MSFIKKAGDNYDPNKLDRLIISSRPGVGKTSALLNLPNSIFFDLEESSGYFKGDATTDVVDIQERMRVEGVGMLTAITRTIDEIKQSGKVYDFAIIDTLTKIDELAEIVATAKYKASQQGKDFKGPSVLDLAYGAGYSLHRAEFQDIIDMFDSVAKRKIYSCHIKDSSIPKDGDQIAITDIKLTGSLKEIFSAKQDAACAIENDPKNNNQRLLNFKKTESSNFIKCRAQHLKNQIISISEITDKNEFITYWDKIFLDLKK